MTSSTRRFRSSAVKVLAMHAYGNRFFRSCSSATQCHAIVKIHSVLEPLKIRAPTDVITMTSSTLPLPLHAVNTFDHQYVYVSRFFTAAQDQRVRSTFDTV